MVSKNYDLAILTGEDEKSGTAGRVFVKIDGTQGSTGWFAYLDPEQPSENREFLPGKIDCGSFQHPDLGEPLTCALDPSGEHESWFPKSVELIDGTTSYTWQFSDWMRSGDQHTIPSLVSTSSVFPLRLRRFLMSTFSAAPDPIPLLL